MTNQPTFGYPSAFGNPTLQSGFGHPRDAQPSFMNQASFNQPTSSQPGYNSTAFGHTRQAGTNDARQEGPVFSPNMIDQLRGIMRDEIRQANQTPAEDSLRADRATRRQERYRENDQPTPEVTAFGSRFKATDLGFFHPDAPESYGTGNIIFAHKETIYRKVFTFVQRINDYTHIVGDAAVKENLSLCFRGAAMSWYLKEIDEFKRRAFRSLPLVDFTDELEARFKMRISKALVKLTSEAFTAKDAKEDREATSYLQNIILYAQSAGISDLQGQLTWAWQQLDIDLRALVTMPVAGTTVQDFTEELEAKRDL